MFYLDGQNFPPHSPFTFNVKEFGPQLFLKQDCWSMSFPYISASNPLLLKPISFKNNAKPPIMTKICTIQPNILVRVGLKYEGWIVQIFVIIGGFALFLKEMGFRFPVLKVYV